MENKLLSKPDAEVLLTYKTATLRSRELQALQDGDGLTDQLVTFYYELLVEANLNGRGEDVLLLDPASVAMFLFTNDLQDTVDIFRPLNL